jgi:hypothetical protein
MKMIREGFVIFEGVRKIAGERIGPFEAFGTYIWRAVTIAWLENKVN